MQFDEFKAKDYPKLSQIVYNAIKQKLIAQSKWITSRGRLQEDQLARELGVSRTPVREAIHKLEKDGLVHVIPRKGAFVRTISYRDVKEIFDIRGALEALAVRYFLSSPDRKKLLEMKTLFESCKEPVEKEDISFFIKLDEEFHDFLIKSSKNQRLIQIMENLNNQIKLARLKSFSVPGRARKALCEHRQIIEAMLSGNIQEAVNLIFKHSENAKQNILSLMEDTGRKESKEERK